MNKLVAFRLTDEQYQELERSSYDQSMTISQYIRSKIETIRENGD